MSSTSVKNMGLFFSSSENCLLRKCYICCRALIEYTNLMLKNDIWITTTKKAPKLECGNGCDKPSFWRKIV